MTSAAFEFDDAVGARNVREFLRPRDIFFHDGRQMRRVSLAVRSQIAAVLAVLGLALWSLFAAIQLAFAAPADSGKIARMQVEVARMQADVAIIKQQAQSRYQAAASAVTELGLDPSRVEGAYTGVGGPLEEPSLQSADPNFKQLFLSWKKLDRLEQATIAIPSTEPVKGTAFTSGFGVRSDPFRGRAAMHAGIDLAGPMGTPIYATADGIVGRSEWANGYGNLVEINHGPSLQTRYGHLSKSLVSAGQRVKRGDLIALMGSTGRSTGSHLHYEVRVDGKAVNPIPFMQGNDYLLAVQRRAAATKVAMGGPAEAAR